MGKNPESVDDARAEMVEIETTIAQWQRTAAELNARYVWLQGWVAAREDVPVTDGP